jgi:signal transduction histidine kinase
VVPRVKDDGVGIKPELATPMFDLFAQAERTPDRASGGLVFGLALVKLRGGTVA